MDGHVRKRGDKWYYSFELPKVNGQRKRVEKIGGKTKKEALAALRKAMDEVEQKGSVFNATELSVSDYLDYFMEEYVKVSLKYNTIKNYETVIRLHIKPYIGHYHLKKITPGNIQELINLKFKEGQAKQSLSILRGILAKSFKMAVHPWGLIKDNPVQYIVMPKYTKPKEPIKIYTIDEVEQFLSASTPDNCFDVAIHLAFHAGLRRSEACGLTWDRVDMENRTITIDRILNFQYGEWVYVLPKTLSSNRVIPFGETLYKILKAQQVHQEGLKKRYGKYYQDTNSVLTKPDGGLVTLHSVKHSAEVIKKRTGIDFQFHRLRHTHLTMLYEMGANLKDVSERAGHSRLQVTSEMYIHLTDKTKRNTVDIFERGLKELDNISGEKH